jgi:hypothetical protein
MGPVEVVLFRMERRLPGKLCVRPSCVLVFFFTTYSIKLTTLTSIFRFFLRAYFSNYLSKKYFYNI